MLEYHYYLRRASIVEQNLYYKSSNKITILGFLGLFLGSALAGIILSIPYLWGIRMIPYMKISFILAIVFGAVLGWVCRFLCGALKVRNRSMAVIAVILGILLYTYFKWSTYVSFIYSDSYTELLLSVLLNPVALLSGIKEINGFGTWSLNDNGNAVSGLLLAIVWLGEFLIIAGIQIGIMFECPAEPFVEAEDKWAVKKEAAVFMRYFSAKEMRTAIEQDPTVLLNYVDNPAVVASISHVRINHYHSSDYSENYITICEVQAKDAKNGKVIAKEVIKKLAVSRAFITDLYAKAGINFAQ